MRMVVVLPAPLGPRKPNTSPRSTESSRSRTAVKAPYDFPRCLNAIMASSVLSTARLRSGSWPNRSANTGEFQAGFVKQRTIFLFGTLLTAEHDQHDVESAASDATLPADRTLNHNDARVVLFIARRSSAQDVCGCRIVPVVDQLLEQVEIVSLGIC